MAIEHSDGVPSGVDDLPRCVKASARVVFAAIAMTLADKALVPESATTIGGGCSR